MTFSVKVVEVKEVFDHPESNLLSVVKVEDYTCISAKLDDGSPRYKVGDLAVYIPENAIMPEWLLKDMEFWDYNKNKGTLAGSKGNRVKGRNFKGVFSTGVLFETEKETLVNGMVVHWLSVGHNLYRRGVALGLDVSKFLKISEYSPQ